MVGGICTWFSYESWMVITVATRHRLVATEKTAPIRGGFCLALTLIYTRDFDYSSLTICVAVCVCSIPTFGVPMTLDTPGGRYGSVAADLVAARFIAQHTKEKLSLGKIGCTIPKIWQVVCIECGTKPSPILTIIFLFVIPITCLIIFWPELLRE